MAISGRQLRFRRGLPVIQLCTARLPRRFAPRNDTSGSAAVHQCPPAVEWLCTRRSLTAATVKFGSACGRRWFVRAVSAFPRLHPKGTSSRCALRAPRPLWGLAMTNLWRSPSYRQPALAVSTAPGPAVPSPTMAGACIGSGPEFAGCTRCVGDAAPYNTPSILQQYPPKMQSLFSETAFFYRPNRRKCVLPARDPSAPGDRAARAEKRRRLRAELA